MIAGWHEHVAGRAIVVLFGLAMAGTGMGCATPTVRLTSDPPGAHVSVCNKTLTTPCTVNLPRGRHSAVFTLDNDPEYTMVEEVAVPGQVVMCAAGVGRTAGYVLRGAAKPFLFVGYVGTGFLYTSAQSGGFAYSSGQSGDTELVLLACAAGGFAVGIPLNAAGEYLEDVSYVKCPDVHVVFSPVKHDEGIARRTTSKR